MTDLRLTAARLREVLHYDPDLGWFMWLVSPSNNVRPGAVAGCIHGPYITICVDGGKYQAHRLAWLWMTGEWPDGEIDHWRDGGTNNVWTNLRDVNHGINLQNRAGPTARNTSGVLGVGWDAKNKKWKAQMKAGGRQVFHGRFATLELATAARHEAERKFQRRHHG